MSLPQAPLKREIDPQLRIERWRSRFEQVLARHLPTDEAMTCALHRAMRYAALDGGKRFRPILIYAAAEALGLDEKRVDGTAAAIEVIHAYSLIHDDLPAMDDDDLRRGRPTVHRAFDEATAILAGDALQALAFQIVSEDATNSAEIRLKLVTALAQACGSLGMAGGQMLDLEAVGTAPVLADLEAMHRLKTGALIELCLRAPGMIAEVDDGTLHALSDYGASIGLAFQIRDDILDVIGESAALGKTAMADIERNKPTFPAIIGLDASRRRANDLRDQALSALAHCTGETSSLAYLADYVVSRDR